jgi:DNA-binding transcriptional LysR family regulator
MAAAGLGYAFMLKHLIAHPRVRAVRVVEPEFWREVSLVTVRGRKHSPAVGALIQIAMRAKWPGNPAIAAQAIETKDKAGGARRR